MYIKINTNKQHVNNASSHICGDALASSTCCWHPPHICTLRANAVCKQCNLYLLTLPPLGCCVALTMPSLVPTLSPTRSPRVQGGRTQFPPFRAWGSHHSAPAH